MVCEGLASPELMMGAGVCQRVEKSMSRKKGWFLISLGTGLEEVSSFCTISKESCFRSLSYQYCINQIFRLLIHSIRVFEFPLQDLLKREVVRGASERRLSDKKLEKNTPKGPNI